MKGVQGLKEILNGIDYPVMVEVIDDIWYQSGWAITWNTDNSEEDLERGDNNTYYVEVETQNGSQEYDGYLVVNGDNGCGDTITYFFNLSKEVKF